MRTHAQETLWTRLSRSWLTPLLERRLAEDAGLPAARTQGVLNPLVGAFLR